MEKKDPPVDKETQTDSTLFTDFGTQTLPCIIHQAVEEIIEIISDDDSELVKAQNIEKESENPESMKGTVIIKLTFKTIFTKNESYYPNYQKFLEHLSEIRSVEPFFQTSYFNNYLYLWSTAYFGKWIMEFLATFKYKPHTIINIEYSDGPPESSSEYKPIKLKTAKKSVDVNSTKMRLIFMKLTGTNKKTFTESNYKTVIQKIRKVISVNENFKNILQENKTVFSVNTVKLVAETTLEQAKRFKDLVSSYYSDIFSGLTLNIFDHYVKLKVIGVTYETTIDQLEKVLHSCLQKTCLKVTNWFVAEYKSPSIFVYVPKKDADFIKTNNKFVVKGKFIIMFDFVDQKN